jgi:hypothetical protein
MKMKTEYLSDTFVSAYKSHGITAHKTNINIKQWMVNRNLLLLLLLLWLLFFFY